VRLSDADECPVPARKYRDIADVLKMKHPRDMNPAEWKTAFAAKLWRSKPSVAERSEATTPVAKSAMERNDAKFNPALKSKAYRNK